MTPTNKTIILCLAAIAVVLGIGIYAKQMGPAKKADTAAKQDAPTTPDESQQPKPADQTQKSDPEFDKNLTADELKLLYTPPSTATAEVRKAHFDLAVKMAQVGTEIKINGCTASPEVLSVKFGSTITVKNTGTSDIKFGVNPTSKILVKAGTSEQVKTDFEHGPGLYGYGCDNTAVRRSIGLILVAPDK